MISILSQDHRYKATLEDNSEGVAVVLYRAAGRMDVPTGSGFLYRVVDRGVLDAPFHLACSMVHDQVWPLTDMRRR